MAPRFTSTDAPTQTSEQPDTASGLRDQYFDCLASGKTCSPPAGQDLSTGSLEFTSPYAEWTLAFNLTTTQEHQSPLNSDERVYSGARNKAAELLALAASTVDKPITLVVQNAQPQENNDTKPTNKNASKIVDGQAHVSLSQSSSTNGGMLIHTYVIHDGEIQELETRPSEGVAADMEALITTAGEQAPSEHVALFAQGHGGGPQGISGDTGSASLEEVDAAIKSGLENIGRDRLDLLDFDSCSMGNSTVIAAMSEAADHIIASAEVESAGGLNVDGQNVTAIVNEVLERPAMSPEDLGETIVALAAQGANGGEAALGDDKQDAGTNTLAHYNASEIESFNQSLENLGASLSQALQTEPGRQAILSAIDASPLASQAGGNRISGTPRAELHDVKTFANNLLSSIESGSLDDFGGNIERAAEALLRGQSEMISSYHGEEKGGYDDQGGLSTFLPGRPYLDLQARADEINPVQSIVGLASDERLNNLEDQKSLLNSLSREIETIERQFGTELVVAPLVEAKAAISNATTQNQYSSALDLLAENAKQFDQSAAGQLVNSVALDRAQENTTRALASEISPTAQDQWTVFLRNLAAMAQ